MANELPPGTLDLTREIDTLAARARERRRQKAHQRDNGMAAANTRHPEWLKDCQRDKNGQVLDNLANALLALRVDSAWRDVVAYDEMRCCVVLQKPVPVCVEDAEKAVESPFSPRPTKDVDVSAAQEWLQLSGIKKLGKETTHQAVDLVA